jgi:hypothetical protein
MPSGRAQYSRTTFSNHQRGHPINTECPSSCASSLALRKAFKIDSDRLGGFFERGFTCEWRRTRVQGNMSSSEILGQSIVETTNDKRNLTPRVTPMTLHSPSCSHDVSKHPGQLGEEGILTLGFCRGGGAARAGEPVTGQFGNHPVPGGSAESATATATGENPQSPHDRHLPAALALDLARPRVRAGLV